MPDEGIKTQVGIQGDKEYKAAIQEINGSLRLLDSEMKASQSAFGAQATTMAGLQDKLDKLSEKYELQGQKVEAARQKLEAMKASGTASAQQIRNQEITLNSYTAAMNKTANEIKATQEGIDTLTEAQGELGEETDGTTLTLKDAEKVLRDAAKQSDSMADSSEEAADAVDEEGREAKEATGENNRLRDALAKAGEAAGGAMVTGLKAAGAALAAVTAAAGAAIVKAFEFSQSAGKYADDIATLSVQTGISTQKLQEWSYASNFIDTSVDTITGSMTKLLANINSAADGSDTAKQKFVDLGVSIYDFDGKLRPTEDVFWDLIDALGQIENPTERDAAAMELFGKSAKELNPLIEAGSRAWRELGQEAEKMGVVFSDENLAIMGAFDDSMQKFNATGEALKNSIGLVMIPAFQPLVDAASESMGKVAKALQDGVNPAEIPGLIEELLGTVEQAVGQVAGVIEAGLPIVSQAVSTIISTLATELPEMLNLLLPAAVELLQGLVNAITENTEPLTLLATNLLTSVATFLIENAPQLADAAGSILTGLVDGITAALPELVPAAISMIGKLAESLGTNLVTLIEKAPEIVAAIVQGIGQAITDGSLLEAGKNIITGLGNAFVSLWESIWKIGGDLVAGIVEGVGNGITDAVDKVKGFFQQILDGIKKLFGVASPSTEMEAVGGFLLEGLGDGLKAGLTAVLNVVSEVFGAIWNAIKSIFGFGSTQSEESKQAEDTGKDIMTGLEDGITGSEDKVIQAAHEAAKHVLQAIRDEFGLGDLNASGNAFTWGMGEQLVDHLVGGLASGANAEKFRAPADAIRKAFEDAINEAFGVQGTGFLGLGEKTASQFKTLGNAVSKAVADGVKETMTEAASQAIGTTFVGNIVTGIMNTTAGAANISREMAQAVLDAAAEILADSAGDKLGADWTVAIMKGVQRMQDAAATVARYMAQALHNAVAAILNASTGSSVGLGYTGGVGSGIRSGTSAATYAASSMASAVESAARNILNASSGQSVGQNWAAGVAQGIRSGTSAITSAAQQAAKAAMNAATKELEIKSPSRKGAYIGQMWDYGIAEGIEENTQAVANAAALLAELAAEETAGGFQPGTAQPQTVIDYGAIKTAMTEAITETGAGQNVIAMDGRIVGETTEPYSSRSTRQRAQRTVKGRTSRLVLT